MSHFTRDEKNGVEIKSFKPRALNGDVVNDYQQVKEKFGHLASTDPLSNPHFSLHPEAKKNLGVETEELSHLQERVDIEVKAQIEQLREQAFQEGFEKGRQEGKQKAEDDYFALVQPQFEQFTSLMHHLDQIKNEVYQANEAMLIQLIFHIGKNITLGELKADRDYVKRLTAQIIEKIGSKENIRITVNKEDYANLENLREFLKTQFPDLKNVQIEASGELALGGVQVETDLSRINASVDAQLHSIQTALSGET